MPIQWEQRECEVLAEYLTLKGLLFAHIPNETFTKSWKQKHKNKAMGVSRGVPDYMIIIPQKKRSLVGPRLLFIEMKREKGGRISPEQKIWIESLSQIWDVTAVVAYGFDGAKKIIDSLLK